MYAWHRFGNLLVLVILTSDGAPLDRYVDDLFGASRRGILWTGEKLFDYFGLALGSYGPGEVGRSLHRDEGLGH